MMRHKSGDTLIGRAEQMNNPIMSLAQALKEEVDRYEQESREAK